MNNDIIRNEYAELISNALTVKSGIGCKLSSASGSTRIYTNEKKLLEDIRLMICTPLGSMLGLPNYGSDIYQYKYEELAQPTYDDVQISMKELLSKFEGVEIIDIFVGSDDTYSKLIIRYIIEYDTKRLSDIVELDHEGGGLL